MYDPFQFSTDTYYRASIHHCTGAIKDIRKVGLFSKVNYLLINYILGTSILVMVDWINILRLYLAAWTHVTFLLLKSNSGLIRWFSAITEKWFICPPCYMPCRFLLNHNSNLKKPVGVWGGVKEPSLPRFDSVKDENVQFNSASSITSWNILTIVLINIHYLYNEVLYWLHLLFKHTHHCVYTLDRHCS